MNTLNRYTVSIGWVARGAVAAACLLLVGAAAAFAQNANISGVVNRYTRVMAVDRCNSSIVVRNPVGFAAGDDVLIIQMKGATIDHTNSSAFGDVTDYHAAGNYELAVVDEVNGATLVLAKRLVREYDVAGLVQAVRVPRYVNATVTGTLTAKAWDGETGGVLALIATGTLTLNADIDASGKGFRGEDPGEPCVSQHRNGLEYYYPPILGVRDSAGYKGEGIAFFEEAYRAGKGKLANGGGGGNARATGGGGGGNAGSGGGGGYESIYGSGNAPGPANGGIGGAAMPFSAAERRVFLGGAGGGAGPEDDVKHDAGTSGGGIVLVRASELIGNVHRIVVNGTIVTTLVDGVAVNGGGAGGGAGGTVLLDVGTFTTGVTLDANGGAGGDTRQTNGCYGPGGGGGGGCIWLSAGSLPAGVTANRSGGAAGLTHRGPACSPDVAYGATGGAAGALLLSLQIPSGTVPR